MTTKQADHFLYHLDAERRMSTDSRHECVRAVGTFTELRSENGPDVIRFRATNGDVERFARFAWRITLEPVQADPPDTYKPRHLR